MTWGARGHHGQTEAGPGGRRATCERVDPLREGRSLLIISTPLQGEEGQTARSMLAHPEPSGLLGAERREKLGRLVHSAGGDGSGGQGEALDAMLENVEKETILSALEQARWNKTAAAKRLGISFGALRYRMQKLGIN